MTPYERLLAEELPTGTFGDAQPTPSPTRRQPRPWTTQEQLDHRRAVEQALDGWEYAEHLRPVPNPTAA